MAGISKVVICSLSVDGLYSFPFLRRFGSGRHRERGSVQEARPDEEGNGTEGDFF
jgi:hypothetical protein